MLKHQPTDHQLSNLYQVPWLPGYSFDHLFEKDAASFSFDDDAEKGTEDNAEVDEVERCGTFLFNKVTDYDFLAS